ncbi:MAG: hypothetical protein K0S93_7 [Nitrososphaeraceae archaeon]|jgi:hypothetical protein|nr:hypothetical protein [Nitrososphaeraceae archaeon]
MVITEEIKKFQEFKRNIAYVIGDSVVYDEYESFSVNSESATETILSLIEEYESESKDKPITKRVSKAREEREN